MSDDSRSDFFSAVDQAPMTFHHVLIWFAASGGALLDGFTVVALGLALPLLKRDFSLSPLLVSLMGSALVLGAAASAWFGGSLADKLGRKRVLIGNMAILTLAGLLAAVAPQPFVLVLAQFLAGVGIGADFPTSASYVSEMMPRKTRSRMTVATIAMQSVGMVAGALVGIAAIKLHNSTEDWRIFFGVGGVAALFFLAVRTQAPESVRWLAANGREQEARALLTTLSREFGEPPPETGASAEAVTAHKTTSGPNVASPIHTLFSARFRIRTLLISLPWLLMDIATYGVGLFTPVILGVMDFDATGGGPVAADFADAKGSAVVDLFLLIGFLASLWAVPAYGRITMQVAGFAGMAIGMLFLLLAAMANDGAHTHAGLVISGFVLFNFAMNIGPNATTFTLAPSLFPTAIRASAAGFAAGAAKVGASLGTFVVPQLQASFGLVAVVSLMVLVSLGGLVATASLAHVVNEEGALEE